MTVIFNNVPAVAGLSQDYPLTGCENQLIFRANNWGQTQVQVDTYSAADPTQKLTTIFVAGGTNLDWCLQCASEGIIYRFSVLNPDPLTTELFVEMLDEGCCCNDSMDCFELPIRLKPCH